MEGSGLKEILEAIYWENAVTNMLTGKAVQRAFRRHLLLDQCLTDQIVSKITNQDFERLVQAIELIYCQVENGEMSTECYNIYIYMSCCCFKKISIILNHLTIPKRQNAVNQSTSVRLN